MNAIDVIASHTTPVSNKQTLHFNVGNSDNIELVAANAKKVISTTLELSSIQKDAKNSQIIDFIKKAKSMGFKSSSLVDFAADIRNFAAKNGMLRKV